MIWTIYAAKDELTNRYKYPTFYSLEHGEEEAKRDFASQVNTTTMWKQNPADFSLHKLAEFNDETGEYKNIHELVCNGRAVLNVQNSIQ